MKNPNKTAVLPVRPLKLSVTQWARELGVDKSTVSRWFHATFEGSPDEGITLYEMLHMLNEGCPMWSRCHVIAKLLRRDPPFGN